MTFGTRKSPALREASGALASASVRGSEGLHFVGAERRALELDVRRRGHALGVDPSDLLDIAQDVRQLPGEQLAFPVGEGQAGQFGDAEDVVVGEGRHGRMAQRNRASVTGTRRSATSLGVSGMPWKVPNLMEISRAGLREVRASPWGRRGSSSRRGATATDLVGGNVGVAGGCRSHDGRRVDGGRAPRGFRAGCGST